MLREIVAAAAFILALAGLVWSAVLVQRMSARQEGEAMKLIEGANEID